MSAMKQDRFSKVRKDFVKAIARIGYTLARKSTIGNAHRRVSVHHFVRFLRIEKI